MQAALLGGQAAGPGHLAEHRRAGRRGAGEGAEIDGLVLIGEGARIGAGAQLVGPIVLGNGCSIGAGAGVREAVLLDRSSLEKGAFLAGGLLGPTRD